MPENFEWGKTNKTPEYLAKFPLGKVPALETTSGFCLIESNAIAFYLAECGSKREQLLGNNREERALVQQWIFFTELQLEKTFIKLAAWRIGLAAYETAEEEKSAGEAIRWLDYIEAHLKEKKWLVNDGAGPSLADITVGSSMYFGLSLYVDAEMRTGYPNIVKWYESLASVPELTDLYTVNFIEKRRQPDQ